MNRYRILDRCVYVQDDEIVMQRRIGAVVSLEDDVAEKLGCKVALIDENPPEPESKPVEPVPNGAPVTFVEPEVTPEPEPEPTPEPEPEVVEPDADEAAKPKPRRGRAPEVGDG